jgi:predicted enzyme related to lactoylglutathione lyase
MRFTDIALITDNVPALSAFYSVIFNVNAVIDPIHTVLSLPGLSLVIYNKAAAEIDMGFNFINTGTGLLTIGFDCEDTDTEFERIKALGICSPTAPQLWPWGAKSFRFSDPDGNLVIIRSFPK